MPRKTTIRNPFAVLGLSKRVARALNELSLPQRRNRLSMLRRFFGSILHPDVTGQSGSVMAEINSALDDLKSGFPRFYKEYMDSASQESDGRDTYLATLRSQAQWWKDKAENQERELKRQLEQTTARKEALEDNITDLRRNLLLAQEKTDVALLLKKLQRLTREGVDQRKENHRLAMSFRQGIFNLMDQLTRDGHNVPKGSLRLSELDGIRLEQKRSWFKVDKDLLVTWGRKRKTDTEPQRTLGFLVGCLAPEDIQRLQIKTTHLRPGSKSYDETLLSIKLYFKEGMQLVTKRGRDNLYIYRPIIKMEPDHGGEVATIETL